MDFGSGGGTDNSDLHPHYLIIRALHRFLLALFSVLAVGAFLNYLDILPTSTPTLLPSPKPAEAVVEQATTMSALKHLKVMPSGNHTATVIFLHVSCAL